MITLRFNSSGNSRIAAAIRSRGPVLLGREKTTMQSLMLELQRRVQEKLSGEVLQSHSGGALRTVRQQTVQDDNTITGTVNAGGGLYWWLSVHERGGEKTYLIEPGIVTGRSDKKALAFLGGGIGVGGQGLSGIRRLYHKLGKNRGSLRRNLNTGGFSEFRAAGGVVVKRVIHPPLPARPFMSTALNELRARIIEQLYATAAKALR